MALGGITAALALVIMMLGGIIPFATYCIPVLCCILLQILHPYLGRSCWVWYCTVAILGLLLCPDKEAAVVFAVIGYYPILKRWFDRLRLNILWKLLYFNASILALYQVLIYVMGLSQVVADFEGLGFAMTFLTLLMGNFVFWMLDLLLTKIQTGKFRRKGNRRP